MDPPKEKGALEADGCCLIIILSVWASLGLGMQPSVIRSSCTFVSLCSAQPQHHLCQNSCAFDIILWVYELLFVIEIYPSNVMWQVVTEHSNSSHCHSTENVWKKNYAASTWVSGPEFTGNGWRSSYNQKITSFGTWSSAVQKAGTWRVQLSTLICIQCEQKPHLNNER